MKPWINSLFLAAIVLSAVPAYAQCDAHCLDESIYAVYCSNSSGTTSCDGTYALRNGSYNMWFRIDGDCEYDAPLSTVYAVATVAIYNCYDTWQLSGSRHGAITITITISRSRFTWDGFNQTHTRPILVGRTLRGANITT
jgi:hypothetical protein